MKRVRGEGDRCIPGYPDRAAERRMLQSRRDKTPLAEVEPCTDAEAILAARAAVDEVHVADPSEEDLLDIVARPRR